MKLSDLTKIDSKLDNDKGNDIKPNEPKTPINAERPADAEPVPPNLASKYGNRITDVWWYAKGREDDPSIGIEIDGLRKTYGGYVYDGWWYFPKPTHYHEDRDPDYSWYRKKKVPDPSNPNDYITIEEYVCSLKKTLFDPDTNKELPIPEGLRHNIDDLISDDDDEE